MRSTLFRSKIIAICWFLFMTSLFFIPGSALPKKNWFTDIHFDKLAHIGFFTVFIFLWRSAFVSEIKYYNVILLLAAVLYGWLVEVLQGWLVANRSFDMYDLLADTAGAVLGLWIWFRAYKKNKPL